MEKINVSISLFYVTGQPVKRSTCNVTEHSDNANNYEIERKRNLVLYDAYT